MKSVVLGENIHAFDFNHVVERLNWSYLGGFKSQGEAQKFGRTTKCSIMTKREKFHLNQCNNLVIGPYFFTVHSL